MVRRNQEMKKKMLMKVKKKRSMVIRMKMKKSLTQFAKLMGFLKREKVLMERNLN
tara:strand:+ start:308 stop:472 length:165 start_codon:yes stop_codon:yes gene_type:complete